MARLDGWWRVLGGAAIVWSLVAAFSSLQAARARPHDRMAEQEAEFRVLAPELPLTGTIGYLEPFGGFTEDTNREHFAAQYALAPRVITSKPDYEFLIVANGAVREGGDPRLDRFVAVAQFPSGHRLFRRFP